MRGSACQDLDVKLRLPRSFNKPLIWEIQLSLPRSIQMDSDNDCIRFRAGVEFSCQVSVLVLKPGFLKMQVARSTHPELLRFLILKNVL